jgi:hypothetical protein
MLKRLSSVVLGLAKSSTEPRGYAYGCTFACGLAGKPFEHPPKKDFKLKAIP